MNTAPASQVASLRLSALLFGLVAVATSMLPLFHAAAAIIV